MRDQNENLLNGRDNNNSEPPRPSIIRRPSNVGLMSNQFKKLDITLEGLTKTNPNTPKLTCAQKAKKFFKKYFLEGQKMSECNEVILNRSNQLSFLETFVKKNRKLVGILCPFTFFQFIWWCLAIKNNFFALFPDRYILSLTMVVGATVGGMTSEGGGAVAFPVMTLALGIKPSIARDFSLMIQSCGMTSAAFTILYMGIQLEYHSLTYCTFGAFFGFVFGIQVVDDLLSSDVKKLAFVSIWFSFAFSLYLLNRQYKRVTYYQIQNFGIYEALTLTVTGFIGGIFTAIAGSGVDICSFSLLTLLFRVSEKVATPTSVVLMAFNTCFGFFWRHLMSEFGTDPEAWKYLACCVPVVVFFGPLGSFLSSHFHRQVLACLIYILDVVALATALYVIPLDLTLGLLVGGLIAGGLIFFYGLSLIGERRIKRAQEEANSLNSLSNDESNLHVQVHLFT